MPIPPGSTDSVRVHHGGRIRIETSGKDHAGAFIECTTSGGTCGYIHLTPSEAMDTIAKIRKAIDGRPPNAAAGREGTSFFDGGPEA